MSLILQASLFTAIVAGLLFPVRVSGQSQLYDNFEGVRALHYGERTGVLDTNAKNPASGKVNNSERCGLYVRNGSKKFANIKMTFPQRLSGVEAYATHQGSPARIKMKVYTTAPAGTLVEILLGKRSNSDYPAGTHSQYQAYTKTSNAWEELEFLFSQIPQGSETTASQIDQLVLLFNPNSNTSDTYYFDDLTGPPLAGASGKDEQQLVNPENRPETGGKSTDQKKQKNEKKDGGK